MPGHQRHVLPALPISSDLLNSVCDIMTPCFEPHVRHIITKNTGELQYLLICFLTLGYPQTIGFLTSITIMFGRSLESVRNHHSYDLQQETIWSSECRLRSPKIWESSQLLKASVHAYLQKMPQTGTLWSHVCSIIQQMPRKISYNHHEKTCRFGDSLDPGINIFDRVSQGLVFQICQNAPGTSWRGRRPQGTRVCWTPAVGRIAFGLSAWIQTGHHRQGDQFVNKKGKQKKIGQKNGSSQTGYPKNGWTQDGFSWFLPGQVSCFSYGWLWIPCKILQTSRILQRVTYVSQEIQVLKYRWVNSPSPDRIRGLWSVKTVLRQLDFSSPELGSCWWIQLKG